MPARTIHYGGHTITVERIKPKPAKRSDFDKATRRRAYRRLHNGADLHWPRRYYVRFATGGQPGVFAPSVRLGILGWDGHPGLLQTAEWDRLRREDEASHIFKLDCDDHARARLRHLASENDPARNDPRTWTEADEERRGLGREALPLYVAGLRGVSLENAVALAEFCRSEPELQTRLDMVEHFVELERPRPTGRNKEAQLKAATLFYIECRKAPEISNAEAARRVISLRHPGVAEYYADAKSIENLSQNGDLMKLAAINSQIWP